jgi:hypothetical protein
MPDTCCYTRCKALFGENNRAVTVPKSAKEEQRRREWLEIAWEGDVDFEKLIGKAMKLGDDGQFPGTWKFCRTHLAAGSVREGCNLLVDRKLSLSANARALRWKEIEERDREEKQGEIDERVAAREKVSTRRSLFTAPISPMKSPAKKKAKLTTPQSSPLKHVRAVVAASRRKPKLNTKTEMRACIKKLERDQQKVCVRASVHGVVHGATGEFSEM